MRMTQTQGNPEKKKGICIAGGWIAVGRKFLERQYKDDDYPDWQRVAFYCWAHCKPGEVAQVTIPVAQLAKELEVSRNSLYKSIRKAKDKGWLAPTQGYDVLQLPSEIVYRRQASPV